MVSRLASGPPEPVQQLRQSERVKKRLPRRAAAVTAYLSTSHAGLAMDWDSNPILSSDSDTDSYSDPNTDPDLDSDADSYSDPYMDPDKIELEVNACAESADKGDSEATRIIQDIAQFRKQGPAKPNHTARTTRLWKAESQFWVE
jgi:hypothetical protein